MSEFVRIFFAMGSKATKLTESSPLAPMNRDSLQQMLEMENNVDTQLSNIKDNLSELPNELLKTAPSFISGVLSIVNTAVSYVHVFDPLQNLHSLISTESCTSAENAIKLVDQVGGHFSGISDHRDALVAAVQSSKIADDSLAKVVSGYMQMIANWSLGANVGVSAIGLLVEAARLYSVWKKIRESKEFVRNGFDENRKSIQDKFDTLPDTLADFVNGLDDLNFVDMGAEERLVLFVTKTEERDALRALLNDIEKEIGDLEVSVNGRIQKLSAYRDVAIPSIIGQVLQGSTLTANTALYFSAAHPILPVISIIAIIGHAVAIGFGFYIFNQSRKTIEVLGGKLAEIVYFRGIVEEKQKEVDDNFKRFCKSILQNKNKR